MAHTFHGYPDIGFLESADQAYTELAQMQQMYDMNFNGWCDGIISKAKNIVENSFDFFPNPSDGLFYFNCETQSMDNLQVYDQIGKLVFSKKLSRENSGTLDLTNLAQGVYLLKLHGEDQTFVKKVLIK